MSGKKHSDYQLEERRRRELEAERRRKEEERRCLRLRQELQQQTQVAREETQRLQAVVKHATARIAALQRARLESGGLASLVAGANQQLGDLRQMRGDAGSGGSQALTQLRDHGSRSLIEAAQRVAELDRAMARAEAELAGEAEALAAEAKAVAATRGQLHARSQLLQKLGRQRARFEQQAQSERVSLPHLAEFARMIVQTEQLIAGAPGDPAAANSRELVLLHARLRQILTDAAAGGSAAQRLAGQIATMLQAARQHAQASEERRAVTAELLRHVAAWEPESGTDDAGGEPAGPVADAADRTALLLRLDELDAEMAALHAGAPPGLQIRVAALQASVAGLRQSPVAAWVLSQAATLTAEIEGFQQQAAAEAADRQVLRDRLAALADHVASLTYPDAELTGQGEAAAAAVARLRAEAWPTAAQVERLSAEVEALASSAAETAQRFAERDYVLQAAVECFAELGYAVLMEGAPVVADHALSPTVVTVGAAEGLVVQLRVGVDGKLVEEVVRPVDGDENGFLTAEEIARYQTLEDRYCADHEALHRLLARRGLKLSRFRCEHTAIEKLRQVRLPDAVYERVRASHTHMTGDLPQRRRRGD